MTHDPTTGLDYPSPTEAVHDPATGMYQMKESEPGRINSGMVETESGLFIPAPKFKPFRRVQALGQGTVMTLEVDESVEEIQRIVTSLKTNDVSWIIFTDPAYGNPIHVQREVLLQPLVIIEDYKDVEALEDEMKQYEQSKRMARIQQGSQARSVEIVEQYQRKRKNGS